MRNASAHITSTTKAALEALAQRVFSTPRPGIDLYSFLTAIHPGSATGNSVFAEYRSEEHTSELQSLMCISYAVFCLKKKKKTNNTRKLRTQLQSISNNK